MNSFLSRIRMIIGHQSDDTLAAHVSGELSSFRSVLVNSHLSRCWQCRARRENLEKAALLVVHFRNGNLASCLPLDPGPRQSFLRKLNEVAAKPAPVPFWLRYSASLRSLVLSMNPVFASVVVVSLAGVMLLWIWQRSAVTVSASELLRRAQASELAPANRQPSGVLYQRVLIKTSHGSFHHAIYKDLSGRRHTRPASLSAGELQAQQTLKAAGVEWGHPLSAADYTLWRDRQHNARDEVRRTGATELTLTTTLDEGRIAEESLTVREADFHPIRRTVETRGEETIEVAELDYAVLGWNAVNESLFEPLAAATSASGMNPSIHPVLPPALPSPMQIDAAELDTRMILNHLHADSQDQIRISHSNIGVIVKGIVQTNQRKHELLAQLDQVPLVHSQILSIEEMREHPSLSSAHSAHEHSGPQVQSYVAGDQPAPVAKFIADKGLPAEQVSLTSKQLVDASVEVETAGTRFEELQTRFESIAGMPQGAQEQFNVLAAAYISEIRNGLQLELDALRSVGLDGATMQSETQPSEGDLGALIAQNQAYCQELITGGAAPERSAIEIAADIKQSAARIRNALATVQKSSPQP